MLFSSYVEQFNFLIPSTVSVPQIWNLVPLLGPENQKFYNYFTGLKVPKTVYAFLLWLYSGNFKFQVPSVLRLSTCC